MSQLTKPEPKTYDCWTEAYAEFEAIVNDCFANIKDPDDVEEAIERRVEDLYAQHKGDPVWDSAYTRWHAWDCEESCRWENVEN
jgi:hypothetical protein